MCQWRLRDRVYDKAGNEGRLVAHVDTFGGMEALTGVTQTQIQIPIPVQIPIPIPIPSPR